MTYTTKSCPHCGTVYQRLDSTRHYYGSPLRTCDKCRKTFVDKDYVEMACQEQIEYVPKRVNAIDYISIIVGIIILLISPLNTIDGDSSLMYLFVGMGLLLLIGGVYMTVSDIRNYDKRCQEQEDELRKSEQRLSDPDYVMALLKIGYYVPLKIKENAILCDKARQLCESIWESTFKYCDSTGIPNNLASMIHIYSAFYCAISDIIEINKLSDIMHTQFLTVTYHSFKISPNPSLTQRIDHLYYQLPRIIANENIDPLSEDGLNIIFGQALYNSYSDGKGTEVDLENGIYDVTPSNFALFLKYLTKITTFAVELFPRR